MKRQLQLLQGEDLTQLQRRIDRTCTMFYDDHGMEPVSAADIKKQEEGLWTASIKFGPADDISIFKADTRGMCRDKLNETLNRTEDLVRRQFPEENIVKKEVIEEADGVIMTYWCKKVQLELNVEA